MKFQLAEWIVDPSGNRISGPEGERRLEQRVMAVLLELIRADGEVRAKDDLIGSVWNGAAVSDHSVANAISDLRRALGDDRRNPRFIETIPKRGYRLLVPATPAPAGRAQKGAGDAAPVAGALGRARAFRGWAMAAAAAGAMIALGLVLFLGARPDAPPRLYLLDIENATGERAYSMTGAAASEMLTAALADTEYRLIRWRRPDFAAESRADILDGGDRVLFGRIFMDGATAHIAFSLEDGEDGAAVWAKTYALTAGEFGRIADQVVDDLQAPLGPFFNHANASAPPQLLEAYWRARYLWSLREHGAIREALRILTEIVEADPGFAPGHAALADIYAHKTAEELALDRPDTFARAEAHLARALRNDPTLAEAWVTRAYLSFFRDQNFPDASSHIAQAIALKPQNAIAWQTRAMIASAAGRKAESLRAIARAKELDPLSAGILWDEVWHLYVSRDYGAALEAARSARRVTAPVHIYEALIRLASDDLDGAYDAMIARARDFGLTDPCAAAIQEARIASGARAGLAALLDAGPECGYTEHPAPKAALFAELGELERAVAIIARDRPREKSWWWSWFSVTPAFDAIRSDDRVARIAERYSTGG